MRILGQVIGDFVWLFMLIGMKEKICSPSHSCNLSHRLDLVAIPVGISQVSAFRLLTVIGSGAEVVIATAYIGEKSPRSMRGRYTSVIFLIGTIGLASSEPVSFFLLQQNKIMGIDSWRMLKAIPAAVTLLLLRLLCNMLGRHVGFYQRVGLTNQIRYP